MDPIASTQLPTVVPTCPVCASPLDATPRLCPRCATPHHADCWEYLGDCAVFGCTSKGTTALAAEQVAWGTRITRVWHTAFLGYSAATTSLALAIGLVPLVSLLSELSYRSHLPAWLEYAVFFLVMVAASLGLAGIFLLAVPVIASRMSLEKTLGQPLRIGNHNAIQVARRMESPGTESSGSWVLGAAAVCIGAGVLLALLGSSPGAVFWIILSVISSLPILLLRGALRDMRVQILAVQNRLLTSAKNA